MEFELFKNFRKGIGKYFLILYVILIEISISNCEISKTFLNQNLPRCKMGGLMFREITISGGQIEREYWDADCENSITADVIYRDSLEEYKPCIPRDTWGPKANLYPIIDPNIIPDKCNLITWQQKRILALIDKFIKKGWNYCHHHSPSWPTPPDGRIPISRDRKGVCSAAGIDGENGWNGIDCTHFTSWVYNYGFGANLATLTGDQACGANAPGKVIPINIDSKNYSNEELSKLQPGDLLFIAGNGSAIPLAVSHGIFWTGIKLQPTGPFSEEILLNNVSPSSAFFIKRDVERLKKAGLDVYVIADSSFNGPKYRIFAGWLRRAFTHVRRLIGERGKESPANMKFYENVCYVIRK